MGPLVPCLVALLVASGSCESTKKSFPQKEADKIILERQLELIELFHHINEPVIENELKTISESWSIENNAQLFKNATAVRQYTTLDHLVPKDVPFNVFVSAHVYEAMTLFNVLYSAKDYETFYKTAVYVRERTNPELFTYVFSIAILNRPDTQGITLPPIYEVLPNFFFNGEIMTKAQRINVYGKELTERFMGHSTTYTKDNNVIIRLNDTIWPYNFVDSTIAYFTHDYSLNAYYYNQNLAYPYWLGSDVIPLVKDRRGERFWFLHKQLLARYYMERLSNGLGEITELGFNQIKDGYNSGLIYYNGIPFSVRPNNFKFAYPEYSAEVQEIEDLERRVRDAIDLGFVINEQGEKINIRKPEAIDIIGNIIESNRDSVNVKFFKDFISLWKNLLTNANTYKNNEYYYHVPLLAPGVMQYYQTALRDPAFYAIWKRVLNLFNQWQRTLPVYKVKELALENVEIEKVEVDKLVTYFENSYVNITSALYRNEFERKADIDETSVLVEVPRLNHKVFTVRINVKNTEAKKVVVRFFLAPKYNSQGNKMWLYQNTENFYQFDQFIYELPAGESVIERLSSDNIYTVDDWTSAHDLYQKVENALKTNGKIYLDKSENMFGIPQHLILPKGRVEGMPFQLMVTITEYRAPETSFGTGFDSAVSYGIGSGARFTTADPLGFPLDRPIALWQTELLPNFYLKDVTIYHKKTDVSVPHIQ